MNVLVTGGAGYVGSHLVDAFLQAAHTVRVLDLQPPRGGCLDRAYCTYMQGSIADQGLAARAVRGVEVIHHLAWAFHPGDERREIQENLFGTLNLLDAALHATVQHFLFASSAVVYGPTGPIHVGEGHSCHPERGTIGGLAYGVTKLACEKLCLLYQRRGLPVTIFRVHGVFSRQRLGHLEGMVRQARAGRPVTVVSGAGGEFIHLQDLLRASLLATNVPQAFGEVFNVTGSYTYQELQLARYIVESAGSESEIHLIQDPTQGMISLDVGKIRRLLGFEPEKGEFLMPLIERSLRDRRREARV